MITNPGLQPFGTPEGSRADLDELSEERFVSFDGNDGKYGSLAIPADDLKARVFVGRKGAGKTVYLRRAQAYAQKQPELFADDIQQELPTTTQIFMVNREFAPSVLTQVWMSIWRIAVLRSLYSYLVHEPLLRTPDTAEFRDRIRQDYGRWLPEQPDPMSVYSQVKAVIRLNRGSALHDYLVHEDWDAIESRIARHLSACPPVCFYLDAIDEEFRHAPMHWLMCQKGLFYQVMRFLRSNKLGGRLHIVISIRDLVYSSVMQTEHMNRYADQLQIRLLEWNVDSISYLLDSKLRQHDPQLFLGGPEARSLLGQWLGRETVFNEKKGVEENIEQYLLRHTRLSPRDVVILLNSLHLAASAAKLEGKALEDGQIRAVVSNAAALFGTEQIAIAGNQLAIGDLPVEAVEGGFVDLYTGEHPDGPRAEDETAPGIEFDKSVRGYRYRGLDVYDGDNPVLQAAAAYQRGIIDDLTTLIREIAVDRFPADRLESIQAAAERLFPRGRALSVLWQNGLLGYTDGDVDTGEPVFYSATRTHALDLPPGKPGYLLHPCLIDAIGIESRGAPVYPFATSFHTRRTSQ